MKILNAKVNWMKGYANDPYLEVLVDKIPRDDLRYEQKGELFFAEHEGYVSFFAYSGPGDGYGGSRFDIIMKDGSKKTLIGPWSSRPGVMNNAGFALCTGVSITDDPKVFERGHTFYGGNLTLEKAKEAATIAEVFMVEKKDGDEKIFVVSTKQFEVSKTYSRYYRELVVEDKP